MLRGDLSAAFVGVAAAGGTAGSRIAGAGVGLLSAVVAASVLHKIDVRPPEWGVWLAWAMLGGTSLALVDRVLDKEPGQAVLAVATVTIWLSFLRAVWLRVR